MTVKECTEAWEKVKEIYGETREGSPKETVDRIVNSIGLEKTKEVFATVAAIKKGDGRIYGKNREYMESIPVNPKATIWSRENPMLYTGLDDIHTAHINQMITELRGMDQ